MKLHHMVDSRMKKVNFVIIEVLRRVSRWGHIHDENRFNYEVSGLILILRLFLTARDARDLF